MQFLQNCRIRGCWFDNWQISWDCLSDFYKIFIWAIQLFRIVLSTVLFSWIDTPVKMKYYHVLWGYKVGLKLPPLLQAMYTLFITLDYIDFLQLFDDHQYYRSRIVPPEDASYWVDEKVMYKASTYHDSLSESYRSAAVSFCRRNMAKSLLNWQDWVKICEMCEQCHIPMTSILQLVLGDIK